MNNQKLKPIVCKYPDCNRYFEKPLNLPCGEMICQQHVKENQNNENEFECKLCSTIHELPKDGFKLNESLVKIINLNLHLDGKHKEAKKKFEEIESLISDYNKTGVINPQNFIFEYFSKIKIQVDLHKEQFINELNTVASEIKSQIDEFQKECMQNLSESNKFNLTSISNDFLANIRDKLRTPNIETNVLNDLFSDMNKILKDIRSEIDAYKIDLLMKKKYEFRPSKINFFGNLSVQYFDENKCYSIKQTKKNSGEIISHSIDLVGHKDAVSDIHLLKDSSKLASFSTDKSIRIWSIDNGQCLATLSGHKDEIASLMSVSKDFLMSSSLDNTLRLWDLNKISCRKVIDKFYKPSLLLFIDEKNFACIYEKYYLALVSFLDFEKQKSTKIHTDRILKLKYDQKTKLIFSCSFDKSVILINSETLDLVKTIRQNVFSMDVSMPNLFFVNSLENSICIWDVDKNICIKKINLECEANDIKLIDRNLIAFSLSKNEYNVIIYDYTRGVCVKKLKGHTKKVYNIDFIRNDETLKLISCSADKTIKIWNI